MERRMKRIGRDCRPPSPVGTHTRGASSAVEGEHERATGQPLGVTTREQDRDHCPVGRDLVHLDPVQHPSSPHAMSAQRPAPDILDTQPGASIAASVARRSATSPSAKRSAKSDTSARLHAPEVVRGHEPVAHTAVGRAHLPVEPADLVRHLALVVDPPPHAGGRILARGGADDHRLQTGDPRRRGSPGPARGGAAGSWRPAGPRARGAVRRLRPAVARGEPSTPCGSSGA